MLTHRMSRTKIYVLWVAMKSRCLNEKNAAYKNYGGRGITVSDDWLSFENFFADMGYPPTGYTLERKNNDGPYSKDNCKWATRVEQAANNRRTLKHDGKTLREWSSILGVKHCTLRVRLKRTGKLQPVDGRLRKDPQ